MAITDINIQLGSLLGATQTGGSLASIRPSVQTTATLNGSTVSVITNAIPLMSVTTLTSFTSIPNFYSNTQSVRMSNIGTAVLTVTDITFSLIGVSPFFTFLSGSTATNSVLYNTVTNTATTFEIHPGSTKEIWLAYKGTEVGEYSNYIGIVSNSIKGLYKVNTQQIIDNALQITATPSSTSTTITAYGEAFDAMYTLEAVYNNEVVDNNLVTYSGLVTSGAGWSVLGQGSASDQLLVRFDNNTVNNVTTGVYTSTILISGIYGGLTGSKSTVNTANIVIDADRFKNLGYWISPASSYNSIIGVSYDLINNEKFLTIGVGVGADSTPTYDAGGNAYASIITLGIKAGPLAVRNNSYFGWANVWRFPITGVATTLYSNASNSAGYLYKEKTTDALDYEYYFGSDSSNGCMFIVEHDGQGNISVQMNNLRELSGEPTFDTTLDNLTRAFYYYSEADGTRYTGPYAQPVASYPPILAYENQTNVFKGFRYNQSTNTAIVDTYLAPYPV
jgi:hypothetical protein